MNLINALHVESGWTRNAQPEIINPCSLTKKFLIKSAALVKLAVTCLGQCQVLRCGTASATTKNKNKSWTYILKMLTLPPIIMEVENGCSWKVTTIGDTRIFHEKNIIMGERVILNRSIITPLMSLPWFPWARKIPLVKPKGGNL